MSDFCSEKNPCDLPVPSEGYVAPVNLGEFLFVSGLVSLPVILLTLAMAIVASRKARKFHFTVLLEAWLVSPSLLTGFIVFQDISRFGVGMYFDYLVMGDGRRELLPYIFMLYLASFLTALAYYRVRMSRQPPSDIFA